MTKKAKCHAIIHTAATTAAGIGAACAQLPGSDVPLIQGVEVTMVLALGAEFGITLTESATTSIIAASLGTTIGRGISQAVIGWFPGFGNAINASTAAGLVESLGWSVYADFAS